MEEVEKTCYFDISDSSGGKALVLHETDPCATRLIPVTTIIPQAPLGVVPDHRTRSQL